MILYMVLLMNPCANIFPNMIPNEFEMSMIGELRYFTGLHVHQSKERRFVNQAKCCKELLIRFGMEKSKASYPLMAT